MYFIKLLYHSLYTSNIKLELQNNVLYIYNNYIHSIKLIYYLFDNNENLLPSTML